MRKIVYMFPGVGSQKIGMGKSFYDNFPIFRETFKEASETLKKGLSELCFLPEQKKELEQLESAQVALLTLCVGIYRVFQTEIGINPHFFMGHSLGEYSALCCAGVIDFPDALELVKQRGIILNEAASALNGIMAWVINLDNKIVESVCEEAKKEGELVFVSAYDAPFQSSISGVKDSVIKIGKKLEKHGAIVYPLKMSGPFHCPLMKPAADKIRSILDNYKYHLPVSPVIANFNALPYKDQNDVTESLSQQLTNPLRWQMSIRYIEAQGVEEAVELGADKVLKHLVKNNSDCIKTFSLDNIGDMEALKCIPSFKKTLSS